jgi:hypothetical protein
MRLSRQRLFLAVVLAAAPAAAPLPTAAAPLTASAPVEISPGDPLAACPPDGSGINFQGSQVEPFIDVNPVNPNNMISVYQQDRYSNGGSRGTVASVTYDGGASWGQVVIPTDTVCTGGTYSRASDPWISFGPTGVAHSMSLVTNADPPTGGFGANGMAYSRSIDGGSTWSAPILLASTTDPRYLHDKNSITADPNDPNYVYAVWDRIQSNGSEVNSENGTGLGFKGPVLLARSTDGGLTFEPARKIYETGANKQTIGNQIVVRPQGEVYDFFGDILNGSRRRGGIGPILLSYMVSTNKGASWSHPTSIADELPMTLFRPASTVDFEAAACPNPALTGACPIRGGDLIPDVAVDPNDGSLHVVWMDSRFSFFQTGAFQWDSIAYMESIDGGLTWSAPIQVNATPPGSVQNSQAFTPSVDVSSDGTVTVTYYDFRNNAASPATLDTNFWAIHCHPGSEACNVSANWDEETQIGPTFNIREAPYARGYFLGDYMGLANAGTDFVSAFGSTMGAGPSSIWFSRLSPP